LRLKRLHRSSEDKISLEWDDSHLGFTTLKTLRDSCPCAGCKGETVLFQTYVAPQADTKAPGRYVLKGAEAIGNYAMRFIWEDGHNEGIYTWEHLRSLCECDQCIERRRWLSKT
jgi:DUF971 family protein